MSWMATSDPACETASALKKSLRACSKRWRPSMKVKSTGSSPNLDGDSKSAKKRSLGSSSTRVERLSLCRTRALGSTPTDSVPGRARARDRPQPRQQELDCDLSIELRVLGSEHVTNSSRPEGRENLVLPELRAPFQRHDGRPKSTAGPSSASQSQGPMSVAVHQKRRHRSPETPINTVFSVRARDELRHDVVTSARRRHLSILGHCLR